MAAVAVPPPPRHAPPLAMPLPPPTLMLVLLVYLYISHLLHFFSRADSGSGGVPAPISPERRVGAGRFATAGFDLFVSGSERERSGSFIGVANVLAC